MIIFSLLSQKNKKRLFYTSKFKIVLLSFTLSHSLNVNAFYHPSEAQPPIQPQKNEESSPKTPHENKIKVTENAPNNSVRITKITKENNKSQNHNTAIEKSHKVSKTLTIGVNKAEFLALGDDVAEIFVANPDIADVQVDNTSGAYIYGRKTGSTTVMVTDIYGKVILHLNLNITYDLEQLRNTIRNNYPNDSVTIESSPQGIILGGTVSSSEKSKDIENIAKGYLTGKDKLVNRISIPSSTQILLKVKIAEVNRDVLNQFGINWGALVRSNHFMYGLLMGDNPIDSLTGGFRRNSQVISGAGSLNSYGIQYRDSTTTLTSVLDALDAESLATILAEPNLMAVSGEVASFLVGGEIPYPVPQSNNNVTIEFKEYGIRLSFIPTVRASNKISLHVRTEVSELDKDNELIVPNVLNGTSTKVPALKTRRAETSVELGDGQSLAIAGLISSSMRNHYDDIPGIADVPILGALFRSTLFTKNQTELVITVTTHLVEPNSDPKALGLPTDNLKRASNLEMLLFQRLNREDEVLDVINDAADINLHGHAGFNVE